VGAQPNKIPAALIELGLLKTTNQTISASILIFEFPHGILEMSVWQ